MSTATIIMVVLICLGCVLVLAGLGVAGHRSWTLTKAARAAGISSRAHLQQIAGRVARLGPRIREIQVKQRAVAEKLSRLSATAHRPYK